MDPAKEAASTTEAPLRLGDTDVESVLSAEFDRMAEAEESGESATEAVEEEIEYETGAEAEVETEVAEGEESAEEVTAEAEEIVTEAEESGYTEAAPERWPEEMRTIYNKLPPEARQMMMEQVYKPMQRTYTQTTQELANMRKAVEPLLQSLNQHRNDFERMGVSPEEAFRTQMAWAAHFAKVGPKQGVADMAAAYGEGAPAGAAGQEEEYLTPVERQMKAQIEELKSTVAGAGQQVQHTLSEAQKQHHFQTQYGEVQKSLQPFISEQKDGKPAHPHIEKVAPAIVGLLKGGLIPRVDDFGTPIPYRDQMAKAYQMACNLNPSIRTAASGKKQVGLAKAAQDVSVIANTPGGQADVPELTVEEQLDREYDKLANRVG